MAKDIPNRLICEALHRKQGLVYLAAKELGCAPSTIYRRAKEIKAVQEAIDTSRGQIIDLAENRLYKAIELGEPWAVKYILSTIGKNRGYVERIESTGKDGGPIENVTIYLPDNGRDPPRN